VASSYATAVSVLGPKRGLRLIEETAGLAARILREQDGQIEFVRSSRWPQP
jgi:thiamine biosynthesis lipoprotein ApbE